jgi:hypothetical protein
MMTLLIVVLVMASVQYSLIKNALVLPVDKTSYICYHCQRIRMSPYMRMLLRNTNELMQSRQNYGTVV